MVVEKARSGLDWLQRGQALWSALPTWLQTTIALGVAAATSYFKRAGSALVDPLLYGLSAFVLVMVGFAAIRASSYYQASAPVTPENVPDYVRKWVDNLGFGIRRRPQNDLAYFEYDVMLRGLTITVARTREQERYLTFTSGLNVAPGVLAKLTPLGVQSLSSEIRIALATAGVGFRNVLPAVGPVCDVLRDSDHSNAYRVRVYSGTRCNRKSALNSHGNNVASAAKYQCFKYSPISNEWF